MNWKTYITAIAVLLLILAIHSQDIITNLNTQKTTDLDQYKQVKRELGSISYSPYGNQALVNIFNQDFRQNQNLILIAQLKNNSFVQHTVIYHPAKPHVILDVSYKLINKIAITNKRGLTEINPKIMQTISTSSSFLTYTMYAFQIGLPICRNLIFIGLLFNLLDIFLPFIIFCQSFVMFAFLNADQYHLNSLFYNILNSKLDLINAIRLSFSSGSDSSTLQPLSKYNFSSNFFKNIGGEFIVTIVFLALTVFVSVFAAYCNSQRFRTIKTKLRPLWNGYFMAIMPRLATLMGFHCRMIIGNEVNGVLVSFIGLSFLVYFIQLLVQTRRINSKVQYIEDSKSQIGLVSRINFKIDFQFDCLRYSMLYYPLMNFLRLLLFFVPIGAAYDLYYISFGGAIVSQFCMMMIEVSSPGYTNKRDKFFYPLNNFLLLNIELCIITVSLAQSVVHPQVSQIAEIILFGIAIALFGNSFIGVLLDTFKQLRNRCCILQEKVSELQDQGTQKFVRQIGKFKSELDGNVIRKTEKTDDDLDNFQQEQLDDHKNGFSKPTSYRNMVKIKKLWRGK